MSEFITDLTVERTYEGPQLLLRWTNPTDPGFTQVQVRRSLVDFPKSITDGVAVYTGSAEFFADTGVVGQQVYYYTVFSEVSGVWYFSGTTQLQKVAFDTSDYDRLWNNLPRMYHGGDASTRQLALELLIGVDGAEYNFNEDQLAVFGQLYRFLKLFGLTLAEARETLKQFEQFYDPQRSDHRFFPFLAANYAFKVPFGTPIARQRYLLANATYLYRIRGTWTGFKNFVPSLLGTVPTFFEAKNNILESNRLDRTSIKFDDAIFAAMGGPADSVDYVLDWSRWARWAYRTIALFVEDRLVSDITPEEILGLETFINDFLPGTAIWYLYAKLTGVAFADDFNGPAFPGWTVTDPNNYLSQSGSLALFTKPAGAPALYTGQLDKAGPIAITEQFVAETDFQPGVVGPAVGTATFTAKFLFGVGGESVSFFLKRITSQWELLAQKIDAFGGAAIIALLIVDDEWVAEGGRLRIERLTDRVFQWWAFLNGAWVFIGEYVSPDPTLGNLVLTGPAGTAIRLTWTTQVSAEFEIQHDKVAVYDAGNWQQLYP